MATTAKKTTSKNTPANKTPAKAPAKTAAKRPVNKTAPKGAAKKTTARKPAAKKTLPAAAPVNQTTTVDLRPKLPVRRRVFVGPMGVQEQAAIRAALAAASARIPVPVTAWNGPTARIGDTVLTHTPAHATTDQPPVFHAAIRCPHGAIHPYTIRTALDLHRARLLTAQCDQPTYQAPEAPHPNPNVRALGDALTRAKASAADTQPIPVIDTETPKGHPQP